MADYHMLNDGVFGVGGSDIMEETANLVNAVSYSHSGSVNTAGQSMMSQSIPGTPGQNPNVMMQGMVSMQQSQTGAPLSAGGMTSYHQGAMHGYSQSEVPQKLHQYSVYGSQLQAGGMAGQYVSGGPRLHHLSDHMSSMPDQPQQSSPRTVVPNQMYQNRTMTGSHYGQQISHNNAASAQMSQGAAQYPGHYASVQHHSMPQHSVQQVNQNADLWQNSMTHSQMTRPCMPTSQSYSQHQMVPSQHGATSLNHSPMTIQGQRPSTPNQSQYMSNQEYAASHAASQQTSMQRPPVYNMNSTSVNQNGSLVGQMNNTPQSGLSQNLSSISQTEQAMTFPQGHYGTSQTPSNRPHYSTTGAVGSTVGHSPQQHVMGQQMMNVRPSVHQMGYSPVSSRVNSGQQHTSAVPPGSPARLQQYHPPFSPNQTYSATQPSPRPANPESVTPPHLHYSNSQPHVQAPMSPQYRSPFPAQVTHSPQHLTPTPPAEVSVPPPLTPERGLQSSTPQSQGSYHSPSTTHLTSPGQGHSPGNSNAPSSLQHLEQMVLPRVSTGPSTTPTASAVSQWSICPAFSHVSQAHSHHTYLNQPHSVAQQPSSSVSNVPNSQPLQPSVPSVSTLSNSSFPADENTPVDSSAAYGSDNSSGIPTVNTTEANVSRVTMPANVGSMPTSDAKSQMSCAPSSVSDSMMASSHQYNMLGKTPYQGSSSSVTYEMQQIQQELQQLYGMHQSPEIHEK
ncbi:atrophin-1-like, partial [Stegodyphus dumicola]|uniref:atrophin-1-like n=1 Tax=Stegodyphus dumicola TaxID=202533 RepID=UPI0015A89D7C